MSYHYSNIFCKTCFLTERENEFLLQVSHENWPGMKGIYLQNTIQRSKMLYNKYLILFCFQFQNVSIDIWCKYAVYSFEVEA